MTLKKLCNAYEKKRRRKTEGIELLKRENIRTVRANVKSKCENIRKSSHQTNRDEKNKKQKKKKNKKQKTKKTKEYLRRRRKHIETKPHKRNLIKGIDTWTVSFLKLSRPFLKWTREELKNTDQWIRKFMTMYKALHPREDIWRERGRGLASIENWRDAAKI